MKNLYSPYTASNLIDGKTGTFAHTYNVTDGIWIRVNLAAISQVYKIEIWNRNDCCKDRIIGMSVYIKNDEDDVKYCGNILEKSNEYILVCLASGNVVELRKEGDASAQNIAEIKVWGFILPGSNKFITFRNDKIQIK